MHTPQDGKTTATTGIVTPAARFAQAVETSLDDLVARVVEAIFDQVPVYRASSDPRLRELVATRADAALRAFARSVRESAPIRSGDFRLSRQEANLFIEHDVPLSEFLQGYRIGQIALWQGVLTLAGDDPAIREAALSVAEPLMHAAEVASTAAAEAYLDAAQYRLAESDRAHRDLLEDLLERREPPPGPRQALLRTAGLEPGTSLLVVTAVPIAPLSHEGLLPEAAALLTGHRDRGTPGLTVLRHAEIIAVLPAPRHGLTNLMADLEQTRAELAGKGVHLAVGISTVHTGLTQLPEAYAEANIARTGAGPHGGMVALPMLSAFDYLILQADRTARRLIRPRVRRFVEEDLARDGGLVATLMAYAAADLNAKTAAVRLHLHVNTVYYRLERIAEKTGCDLRRFGDVVELSLAVRLLGPDAPE
ncbi:PucR family transcriptional regulator [Streptomyces canus]|uniref:PucR family transcriptional regulator n=1 Tax=Streptomyces canus TaxID=58343 RepID=UPI0037180557